MRQGAPDRNTQKMPLRTRRSFTRGRPRGFQHGPDGGPFVVGEFVAHDSRLRFGSLNHVRGGTINPQKTIAADANTLISLPLSGAQPTWQGLLLVRPRS
jgi:hypothetical protein